MKNDYVLFMFGEIYGIYSFLDAAKRELIIYNAWLAESPVISKKLWQKFVKLVDQIQTEKLISFVQLHNFFLL
jgi:hypothetical protein